MITLEQAITRIDQLSTELKQTQKLVKRTPRHVHRRFAAIMLAQLETGLVFFETPDKRWLDEYADLAERDRREVWEKSMYAARYWLKEMELDCDE